MQIDLQRFINYLLLALAVCGGIVTGMLSGRLVDLSLGGENLLMSTPDQQQVAIRQLSEEDFQVILSRSLFNSQAVGQANELVDLSSRPVAGQETVAARPLGELNLIGTVVAGKDSLALIQVGGKIGVYRLDANLAPGVKLIEIARHMVAVRENGKRRELLMLPSKDGQSKLVRQPGKPTEGVVALGKNRWQVSKAMAENARANLNALMRSARMTPQVKDGQTIGFTLVELQRGSLLEQIGLKVGDLVVEINQVELNSPEKALQIFQQLREANNISLGLVRNGQRETFEYNFE